MKYKIVWKSKITGFTGEGEPDDDYLMLKRVAEEIDRKYPELTHEVVPVSQNDSADTAVDAAA